MRGSGEYLVLRDVGAEENRDIGILYLLNISFDSEERGHFL